eukprot:352476-Chlamydomonas_euryale.AAC.34
MVEPGPKRMHMCRSTLSGMLSSQDMCITMLAIGSCLKMICVQQQAGHAAAAAAGAHSPPPAPTLKQTPGATLELLTPFPHPSVSELVVHSAAAAHTFTRPHRSRNTVGITEARRQTTSRVQRADTVVCASPRRSQEPRVWVRWRGLGCSRSERADTAG